MPFKKGTSGNPIGRPKGSLSTTSKLIREHISQAIDGNKIMEMLDNNVESLSYYQNIIKDNLKNEDVIINDNQIENDYKNYLFFMEFKFYYKLFSLFLNTRLLLF